MQRWAAAKMEIGKRKGIAVSGAGYMGDVSDDYMPRAKARVYKAFAKNIDDAPEERQPLVFDPAIIAQIRLARLEGWRLPKKSKARPGIPSKRAK